MATLKAKKTVEDDTPSELPSQRKQRDAGRYCLQVDRQTKRSFETSKAAEEVGAEIKKNYPVVHVVVYDTVDHTRKTIETA